jgi:SM-20-related protein
MLQSSRPVCAGTDPAILELDKLRAAPLIRQPFEYLILRDFIRPEWKKRLADAYPHIRRGGSFPLSTTNFGDDFAQLISALDGPGFRQAVEHKFSIDLEGRPTMFTVRGRCRATDGKIHTDTESKIITVLLYMNPEWADQGGRLRLLNSATDIDDVAAEVPPAFGTLLIFKRCDYSYHGHLPFEGDRKVIQMNWVTHQRFVERESKRHRWSAFLKKLGAR